MKNSKHSLMFLLIVLPLLVEGVQLHNSMPSPSLNFQLPDYSASLQHSERMPIKVEDAQGRIEDILNFWFGHLTAASDFPEEKLAIWFGRPEDVDRLIREQFSLDIEKAQRGELNVWRHTARGRLALILLLDQFPRHIYRNQPQAFVSDAMAKGLVLEGLHQQHDKQLYPIERAFFYLPLEHTENVGIQQLSVGLYKHLAVNAPPSIRPQMHSFLDYALLHQKQIERFGRFPHRNAILGRSSTPEEIVFLHQWKSFL